MIRKIFFWDDELDKSEVARYEMRKLAKLEPVNVGISIFSADLGPTKMERVLQDVKNEELNSFIMTNFLEALNPNLIDPSLFPEGNYKPIKDMFYLWDKELNRWKPIEKFTDKELRYEHNLAKMYYNGAFNI